MAEPGIQDLFARRVVLEFDARTDPVSGVARTADDATPQRFSGWMDLLRLLEGVSDGPPDPERGAQRR